MFGKLIAAPVRLLNVPFRALEEVLDVEKKDRVMSQPLEGLAKLIEQAVDGEEKD